MAFWRLIGCIFLLGADYVGSDKCDTVGSPVSRVVGVGAFGEIATESLCKDGRVLYW